MVPPPAVVEGVSGAAGGVAALLATYPLMTISTLQATRRREGHGDEEQFVVPVQRRKGTFADIAEVISTSGWQGLYRGLQPAIFGTTVSQGIYFYLYAKLRNLATALLQERGRALTGDIGVGPSLLVAFLAGCGNVLITNPIWIVSTRMQAHQKQSEQKGTEEPSGPIAVAQEIVAEGGILGLWKGVLPSLVMVSNPTVNYMLYEWLLARLAELKRKRVSPPSGSVPAATPMPTAAEVFAISAAAKFGATIVTYPLLLIKQRLQSAGRHTHADRQYNGTLDAVRRIWNTEGLLGFYGGLNTKIVQSILAAALMMAIKEKLTEGTRRLLEAGEASRAAAAAQLPLVNTALPK